MRVLGSRFCQLCVVAQGSVTDMGEFLTTARQASPDTRFLLIANREDIDAVLALFSQGLSDALLQPINPKRAVSSLQRLLGKDKAAVIVNPGGSIPPFPAEATYRPLNVAARSPAMRRALNELWAARNDPVGVVLRGETGSEFELIAREFQAMGGDVQSGLVVIGGQELDVETLATQVSLDRLNEGVPRTYFVPDVENLRKEQEKPLLEFLRRARRMREKEKPLRIVFTVRPRNEPGASDPEFLEELQFIVPAVVTVAPLRERREDIEPIVRRVITDLTAIFPAYRARSVHPGALQWLVARNWRGNHEELVAALRRAVAECPNRELTATHFGKLTETGPDVEEQAAARVLAAVERATTSARSL
jgi:DNA-binding NtrC family response regulator